MHGSKTFEFDPADIERLTLQSDLVELGEYPWWPSKPIFVNQKPVNVQIDDAGGRFFMVWQPDFDGWYSLDLPQFIRDLCEALKLPLCDAYLAWMRDLFVAANAEQQARLRAATRAEIARRQYGPSNWASADLLAEVRAVCGEGRRSGVEWWFKCPFHRDNGPSLEVNPEKRVWHCWGCGKAGGVVDWRKRVS